MRILVTKLGDELVKEMSIEHNETLHYRKIHQTYEQNQKLLNQSQRLKSNSQSKSPKSSTVSFTNNNNNFNNKTNKNSKSKSRQFRKESSRSMQKKLDQESKLILDEDDLQNSKRINIKQKRLQIPKYLTEKYNSDSRSGFILPNLTIGKLNDIANKTRNAGGTNYSELSYDYRSNGENKSGFGFSGMPESRANFTFREIINQNAIDELKRKLKKEKRIEDALSRIDESKFRSVYGEQDRAQKFEDLLDKTINANKITLIKYINDKQKISDNFIKKICESDDEKIMKANKICQIVFHNKEKEQLLNDIIKERMRLKKNKETSEYKIDLEQMGETLKDFSVILNDYIKKPATNKFVKYKDIHNDLVNKYWKRFNVENLMFKTVRSRSSARSIVESRNMNLSKTQGSFGI